MEPGADGFVNYKMEDFEKALGEKGIDLYNCYFFWTAVLLFSILL